MAAMKAGTFDCHAALKDDTQFKDGGDLVADPLARDLALELGEGKQHVEG